VAPANAPAATNSTTDAITATRFLLRVSHFRAPEDKALAWGKQFCLRKTDPRWVFAVGKGYPNFNHKVGLNPTCIVATEDCSFYGIRQSCYIWWEGWWESLQRWAFMRESKYFGGGRDWFAFRK
jgi:hypothetical protein